MTREERLQSASTVAYLSKELIQGRTPQQSVPWLKQRGHALLELRSFDEAESVLSRSLELAPDDEEARTSRGYLYLLEKQPKNALTDFKYIRDVINPESTMNYLRRHSAT
jgi:Flp pilus assembly protein TadD